MADLDRLLNKALQAPSLGGGCVIPITVPYCLNFHAAFCDFYAKCYKDTWDLGLKLKVSLNPLVIKELKEEVSTFLRFLF